jgi:hypothetical protein
MSEGGINLNTKFRSIIIRIPGQILDLLLVGIEITMILKRLKMSLASTS